MPARPRIDLDGLPLHGVGGASDPTASGGQMPLANFRRRTVEGLLLLIPESADLLIPWDRLESASVDLLSAQVHIVFKDDYAARQRWLRGSKSLEGGWLDRFEAHAPRL